MEPVITEPTHNGNLSETEISMVLVKRIQYFINDDTYLNENLPIFFSGVL